MKDEYYGLMLWLSTKKKTNNAANKPILGTKYPQGRKEW
jgi:hypothetical protein